MTYKEIQDLIKLVTKMNLSEFKLREGEFEISIRTDKYFKDKAKIAGSPVVASPQVSTPPPAPVTPAPQVPSVEEPKDQSTDSPPADNGLLEIRSPIVGTFYRSPSPDKDVYVKVGDSVEKGSVVCIVEAMKLFNEIESEVSGKIVKVVVDDASPVEYDQVLFLVDPKG